MLGPLAVTCAGVQLAWQPYELVMLEVRVSAWQVKRPCHSCSCWRAQRSGVDAAAAVAVVAVTWQQDLC